MLQNSSEPTPHHRSRTAPWIVPLLGYGIWLLVVFVAANWIISLIIAAIQSVIGPLSEHMSISLANSIAGVFLYAIMLVMMVWLPAKIMRRPLSLSLVGLDKKPTFIDIALGPSGVLATFIGGAMLTYCVTQLMPGFDAQQAQEVGVSVHGSNIEVMAAFIVLVIIGPFVEELIFRGYLYGTYIKERVPEWLSMIAVSLLFGMVHRQWNVGIVVFCLSMAACLARKYTGSIWAGVVMHMIKNGMAFYVLTR